MYVETDIPLINVSKELLDDIKGNLPELPEEKMLRIIKEYFLSEDLAKQLVRTDRVNSFEEIKAESDVDSTIIASTLAYTLKELRRDGCMVDELNKNILLEAFGLLEGGKISKDAIPQILANVCNEGNSPEEAAESLNLTMLSEGDVEKIINEIIESNKKIIDERGMGAMGSLMGMAMKKLKGKADGKLVNKLLRDKLQNIK
jgi:glutamyl-tRNA(Gln) amidotransferase subunit E